MQRTRYGGGGGGGGEEGAPAPASDGMVDVTFHTAEWHAGGSGVVAAVWYRWFAVKASHPDS